MTAPDSIDISAFREVRSDGGPEGAPALRTVVLLHGRGSNEEDLPGLLPHLPSGIRLLSPRAPFPGADWGYGGGWAWYRYLAEDRVVGNTLEASLDALDRFLVERGVISSSDDEPAREDETRERTERDANPRRAPFLLGGFSQGGTTALAWALRRAARGRPSAPVINFSGFLVDDPAIPVDAGASSLDLFWGHGEADPAIPFGLAERGRSRLEAAGAELRVFDHPGGHGITGEELEELRSWMDRV